MNIKKIIIMFFLFCINVFANPFEHKSVRKNVFNASTYLSDEVLSYIKGTNERSFKYRNHYVLRGFDNFWDNYHSYYAYTNDDVKNEIGG